MRQHEAPRRPNLSSQVVCVSLAQPELFNSMCCAQTAAPEGGETICQVHAYQGILQPLMHYVTATSSHAPKTRGKIGPGSLKITPGTPPGAAEIQLGASPTPKMHPRGARDHSGTVQKRPRDGQEAAKRRPRAAKRRPRALKMHPRSVREAPGALQNRARRPSDATLAQFLSKVLLAELRYQFSARFSPLAQHV